MFLRLPDAAFAPGLTIGLAQPAVALHDHAGHLGAAVMPFDLARSTRIFTPTVDGGTQEVVSRDGDVAQISLIRGHLRKEAAAFARGDYGDPAAIHGQDMPGLAALRSSATRVHVGYEATRTVPGCASRQSSPSW